MQVLNKRKEARFNIFRINDGLGVMPHGNKNSQELLRLIRLVRQVSR